MVSVRKDVDVPLSAATVPGNDESDSTLIVPVLGSLEAARNLRVIQHVRVITIRERVITRKATRNYA